MSDQSQGDGGRGPKQDTAPRQAGKGGQSAEEIKLEEVKGRIEYPTIYAFKVMGKQEHGFRLYVKELFSRLLGHEVHDSQITEQPSKGARYVSVTVSVELHSEEQRRTIYSALYAESTGPDARVKYYL